MSFVMSQRKSYTWPVKHRIQADGGTYETVEFLAEFKRVTQSRIDEITQRAHDGAGITDEDVIADVLLGWSGIKTETGAEFAWSESNQRLLFDTFPGLRTSILLAFYDSHTGVIAKNLATPR